MERLSQYIQCLKKFYTSAQGLHTALDGVVQLIPVDYFGQSFTPTFTTVLAQLQNWPKELITAIPPVAWVYPRKGELVYSDAGWEYAFHGQGVVFMRFDDQLEVSVEYTALGKLGMVEEHIEAYLMKEQPELCPYNHNLFNMCVERGILVTTPPRYGSDSATYLANW